MFRGNICRGPVVLRNTPLLHHRRAQSTYIDREQYWNHVAPWKDTSTEDFLSFRWQLHHSVFGKEKLETFLHNALPDFLGPSTNPLLQRLKTRQDFIEDAVAGLKLAPMSVRLTPHILSRVDWENPLDDPIRKQFIPLKSGIIPDHKELTLDSLHEEADSPVPGLVHRYPGRALFLVNSICPVYCRFCTRSYAVGANTDTVSKVPQKPSRRRWDLVFDYIENNKSLEDIVISGGDAYYLNPDDMKNIGERLLNIKHVRRMRFASKGLAVAPSRILDKEDPWTKVLLHLSKLGRQMAKQVCLHTHFNHANEITWVTERAANFLFENGVIVRNQSVLLRGVNDSHDALKDLIQGLSNMNIQPYYIYQCDMVRGIEDLRTPLSTLRDLDMKIRGTFSGFMIPSFVVDLPGGGGKRLVSTVEKYNAETGESIFTAPGLPGEKGMREYKYYDPAPLPVEAKAVQELHEQQDMAMEQTISDPKNVLPKITNRSRVRPLGTHVLKQPQEDKHQEDIQRPQRNTADSKPEKTHENPSQYNGVSPTRSSHRLQPNQTTIHSDDQSFDSRVSARGFHNQPEVQDTSFSGGAPRGDS